MVVGKESREEDRDFYLMGRITVGDRASFAELFDRSAPTVLGFLVRILRSRGEAEEILQEVFLQVWQQAGVYRPSGLAPISWILLLARHRAIDRLRSEVCRNRREELYEEQPARDRAATPLGTARMEERETLQQLEWALQELPKEQRTCIELAFFEGLTHRDIADRLRAPLGTVKSRIRAGLLGMKRALADAGLGALGLEGRLVTPAGTPFANGA